MIKMGRVNTNQCVEYFDKEKQKMANCSASQFNLAVRNDSQKPQSEILMSTLVFNSDPPPPYTVIDAAPTPVPPEIVEPMVNQVIQSTIFVAGALKNDPVFVHCPRCDQTTLTSVQIVNTQKTHMLAGFICGLTFWCMLCCLSVVPYMIPTSKNTDHYCSQCNYFIGSYSNSK